MLGDALDGVDDGVREGRLDPRHDGDDMRRHHGRAAPAADAQPRGRGADHGDARRTRLQRQGRALVAQQDGAAGGDRRQEIPDGRGRRVVGIVQRGRVLPRRYAAQRTEPCGQTQQGGHLHIDVGLVDAPVAHRRNQALTPR